MAIPDDVTSVASAQPPPATEGQDGETRGTVYVAMGANLVIAVAKVVGGIVSGSSALLSEAAHSVADSLNEVFLLAALKRSRKLPDSTHPFGYGKERYFWSLLAAVGIFVMGGCFSFYQGVHTLSSPSGAPSGGYLIAVIVLCVAGLTEGASLVRALWQLRNEARRNGRSFGKQFRNDDDPALRTVIGEDGAAVTGVLFALAGVFLHLATGDSLWEGLASFAIALLLIYVAYRLGRDARGQLVGEALSHRVLREVHAFLERQPEIDEITALLTMRLSPDSALLAARVDLRPGADSEEVEQIAVRIKGDIADGWSEIDHVFLDITDVDTGEREPAPRAGQDASTAAEL